MTGPISGVGVASSGGLVSYLQSNPSASPTESPSDPSSTLSASVFESSVPTYTAISSTALDSAGQEAPFITYSQLSLGTGSNWNTDRQQLNDSYPAIAAQVRSAQLPAGSASLAGVSDQDIRAILMCVQDASDSTKNRNPPLDGGSSLSSPTNVAALSQQLQNNPYKGADGQASNPAVISAVLQARAMAGAPPAQAPAVQVNASGSPVFTVQQMGLDHSYENSNKYAPAAANINAQLQAAGQGQLDPNAIRAILLAAVDVSDGKSGGVVNGTVFDPATLANIRNQLSTNHYQNITSDLQSQVTDPNTIQSVLEAQAGILNTASGTGGVAATGTAIAPTSATDELVIQQAQSAALGSNLGLGELQFANILGATRQLISSGGYNSSESPTAADNVAAVTAEVNTQYNNGGGQLLTSDQVATALNLLDKAAYSLRNQGYISA